MDDWAHNNKLCVSTEKSAAMHISHNKTTVRPTYFLGGTPMKTVGALPTPDVIFSPCLDFSAQVTRLVTFWGLWPVSPFPVDLRFSEHSTLLSYHYSLSTAHQYSPHTKLTSMTNMSLFSSGQHTTLYSFLFNRHKLMPAYDDRLKALKWPVRSNNATPCLYLAYRAFCLPGH